MTMASKTVWPEVHIDAGAVIQEALTQLESAREELILDFTAVHRIDPPALKALGELVAKAGEKSVRLVARGVNVQVYKVLKLAKVAGQITFQ
jgi:anti-anti-sigma regulatory factor